MISVRVAKIRELVKERGQAVVLALLVFLISLLSFGIGYLTAQEDLREPVRIEQPTNGTIEQEK